MRYLIAFASGCLFGLGLLVSGMVDTNKVQGWLDIFGDWDPTLAFVLGGAILPMAVAWRIANTRRAPIAGGAFPKPAKRQITPELAIGSVLFGAGWGLASLCPGPSLAALSFGGWEGVLFVASMMSGMLIATPLRGYRLPAAASEPQPDG